VPTHLRLLSVLAFLLLANYPVELCAQPKVKIVVGYASMSSVATTLWVAQEKGFFAKNGIEVQTIFIPGSPTLIASLNTGDVLIRRRPTTVTTITCAAPTEKLSWCSMA
jgi:ABC-type nitrate/sulfonate/bicarbonate transport system substrate-binding protein